MIGGGRGRHEKRQVKRTEYYSAVKVAFVVLAVLTTQLQVTVINCHIARNFHIAPGTLWVIVRVTALVSHKGDLGDEVFAPAEGHYPR